MLYCLQKIKKNIWRYHYFTPVYRKYWLLRYWVWQTEIGNYRLFFALLPPLKTKKNQNFENNEINCWWYHHLHICTKNNNHTRYSSLYMEWEYHHLHICTKNNNHMRYSSWYMEWDRQNRLSFWANFYPFILLATQKIKIFKNWKTNTWIYYKMMITWCIVPNIWNATDRSFCHFGLFFALLPP